MTIATRQKNQLLPLSLDMLLHGVKVEQVAEHRLLGIIIDNKLRWDTHTDTLCKTLSKRDGVTKPAGGSPNVTG